MVDSAGLANCPGVLRMKRFPKCRAFNADLLENGLEDTGRGKVRLGLYTTKCKTNS